MAAIKNTSFAFQNTEVEFLTSEEKEKNKDAAASLGAPLLVVMGQAAGRGR